MKLAAAILIPVLAAAPAFSQTAVEQLSSFGGEAMEIPVPGNDSFTADNSVQDEDFSPELPKTPPPDSVNIDLENSEPPDADFKSALPSRTASSGIPYLDLVLKEAKAQNFDAELILAVIKKESSFNPKAHSSVGAMGLMQLMPDTAKWLGLKDTSKLYVPSTNIKYGIKYLRYLFSQFCEINTSELKAADIENQSVKKSIASYNAGPNNIKKYDKPPYNGIPPFKETKSYVKLVSQYFSEFESMNIPKQ